MTLFLTIVAAVFVGVLLIPIVIYLSIFIPCLVFVLVRKWFR
jgi:hypothetical protein